MNRNDVLTKRLAEKLSRMHARGELVVDLDLSDPVTEVSVGFEISLIAQERGAQVLDVYAAGCVFMMGGAIVEIERLEPFNYQVVIDSTEGKNVSYQWNNPSAAVIHAQQMTGREAA